MYRIKQRSVVELFQESQVYYFIYGQYNCKKSSSNGGTVYIEM